MSCFIKYTSRFAILAVIWLICLAHVKLESIYIPKSFVVSSIPYVVRLTTVRVFII